MLLFFHLQQTIAKNNKQSGKQKIFCDFYEVYNEVLKKEKMDEK